MLLTITLILPSYVSCNSSQPSKVFEGYPMRLFSSRFYKYFTKYIKLFAQKIQLAKILEILVKFQPFLLKKRGFSSKIAAVMLIYNVNL